MQVHSAIFFFDDRFNSSCDETRMSDATVHFASFMDIYHVKNAELEAKHQKYKGRVVIRGYIFKRKLWIFCSIH